MSPWMEKLYYQAPVWCQNLLVTAYGLKLRKERFSPAADSHLADLLHSERLDAVAMSELQSARFVDLARTAILHVPHYRQWAQGVDLNVEDIKDLNALSWFPILEKSVLREDPQSLVDERILASGNYFTLNTSGSSGSPITIYADVASRTAHYAFWSRLRHWFGVAPLGRRATLFGRIIMSPEASSPPFWRYDRFQRNLLMSSYHLAEANLPAYYAQLQRYQPEEIVGYPSSIYPIAKYIAQHQLPRIKAKVVFTTAETLLSHQRSLIEASFDAPVIDQYGCTEMALFVSQCEHGSMHLHPEHGILEVVDADDQPVAAGETGEAVCTGLVNQAMPLIRYRLGDCLTPSSASCGCGRAFPELAQLAGRVDDILVTPDGRPLGRMDPIFKGLAGIYETQIIQTAKDRLQFNLVTDSQYDQAAEDALRYEILKRTGEQMQIVFSYLEAIPKNANGKFKSVVSDIPTEEAVKQ
ncbi:phenylacetate--CoA ligase family protein [Corallincola spongiicola]|uniref:Phenylacetate--CoA ligase family protein n=1 Tax=Corallincola spongiicola TaxID=2520508 RepID=A0ABY1WPW6_9GAMM|nr:phenylacetate--CoA ligase family protein [Corallincola spongiicola]TAA46785.1 phenylacetate--CoA ligase family protein [Corallincola spongiicola]